MSLRWVFTIAGLSLGPEAKGKKQEREAM